MTTTRTGLARPTRMCAALLVAALGTGCMTAAHVAMEVEKSSNTRQLNKSIAVLRQHIQTLQAQGDPLGDYFYALANSDGWIKDVTEPKAITELFERAAAKGSMDAKILLALQEAMDEPVPGKLDYGQGSGEDLAQWERGLARLLPLVRQQCYARRLVVTDGRPRVRYYTIAYKVWPHFRNGYYRLNADGTRTLLKDAERQKLWEGIDDHCYRPHNEWLDVHYTQR
ncbi:hypothetical protein J2W49_001858 [Hydrogenophaga palleronii]|uniref:Lipoprotein n=1 Tax=Hydrogenophaga palleronii TaxID=65655 RepID=A0ABU1WKY9_9BURK|nr:hypothetical protein [Hydrogenophaga palleronii]MDR7149903.1 hypothetical protein [Hydrogenophaga palleronii]